MDTSERTLTVEDLLTHARWLNRLAARLVDPASADDIVQDTWVAALRSPPHRDGPLRPWLAQVARNLARNRARGRRRWLARVDQVSAIDDQPLPTAEQLATQHEAQRLVAEEVAGLDEPFRSTVLLCYGEGLAPAEVARRQGIPAGTVRWRLKRGLDDVRARLDARHGQDRGAWLALLGPLAAKAAAPAGTAAFLPTPLVAALAVVSAVALFAIGTLVWRKLARPPSDATIVTREAVPARAMARPPRLLLPGAAPGGGPGRPGEPSPSPNPGAGPVGSARAAAPQPPSPEAIARAVEVGNSPTRGDPAARVTMVLYADYQCRFTAMLMPTLNRLQVLYPKDVRLVVKNLPLPFHGAAPLASEAALAAHAQGKFWEMHQRLFSNQERLTQADLEEHARAVGLDVGQFRSALESQQFRKQVTEELRIGDEAGVKGTPAVFVNGKLITGAFPLDHYKRLVDGILNPQAPVAKDPVPHGGPADMYWPPPRLTLPDEVFPRFSGRFAGGDLPRLGPSRAPVVVEYLIARPCNDCASVLRGVLASYGPEVRVVARPIAGFWEPGKLLGRDPAPIAVALWEAHDQDRFWALHDALAADFPGDRTALEEAAVKVGMDRAKLSAALDEHVYDARVLEDARVVQQGRAPLPAFVVDGRVARSGTGLSQLVEGALRRRGRPVTPPRHPPTVVTDPRSPGFKPNEVFRFLVVPEVFAVEPRDAEWAPAVEQALRPLVSADLAGVEPRAAVTHFECRATLCRLRTRGPVDSLAVHAYLTQVYRVRDIRDIGNGVDDWYLELRARNVSAEDSVADFRGRRGGMLHALQTGRVPLLPPLKVAQLPR